MWTNEWALLIDYVFEIDDHIMIKLRVGYLEVVAIAWWKVPEMPKMIALVDTWTCDCTIRNTAGLKREYRNLNV